MDKYIIIDRQTDKQTDGQTDKYNTYEYEQNDTK